LFYMIYASLIGIQRWDKRICYSISSGMPEDPGRFSVPISVFCLPPC
jgi:hypothetical protein